MKYHFIFLNVYTSYLKLKYNTGLLDTINNEMVLMFSLEWHFRNTAILLKCFLGVLRAMLKMSRLILSSLMMGKRGRKVGSRWCLLTEQSFQLVTFRDQSCIHFRNTQKKKRYLINRIIEVCITEILLGLKLPGCEC